MFTLGQTQVATIDLDAIIQEGPQASQRLPENFKTEGGRQWHTNSSHAEPIATNSPAAAPPAVPPTLPDTPASAEGDTSSERPAAKDTRQAGLRQLLPQVTDLLEVLTNDLAATRQEADHAAAHARPGGLCRYAAWGSCQELRRALSTHEAFRQGQRAFAADMDAALEQAGMAQERDRVFDVMKAYREGHPLTPEDPAAASVNDIVHIT